MAVVAEGPNRTSGKIEQTIIDAGIRTHLPVWTQTPGARRDLQNCFGPQGRKWETSINQNTIPAAKFNLTCDPREACRPKRLEKSKTLVVVPHESDVPIRRYCRFSSDSKNAVDRVVLGDFAISKNLRKKFCGEHRRSAQSSEVPPL